MSTRTMLYIIVLTLALPLLVGCSGSGDGEGLFPWGAKETGDGSCDRYEKYTLCTKNGANMELLDTYSEKGHTQCKKGYYYSHLRRCDD